MNSVISLEQRRSFWSGRLEMRRVFHSGMRLDIALYSSRLVRFWVIDWIMISVICSLFWFSISKRIQINILSRFFHFDCSILIVFFLLIYFHCFILIILFYLIYSDC